MIVRTTNSLTLSWLPGQIGQGVRYEIWASRDGTNWAPLAGASALSAISLHGQWPDDADHVLVQNPGLLDDQPTGLLSLDRPN